MGKFNWINGQAGGTPLSAENLNQMQDNLLKLVFPIGSTYITQNNTNPTAILGFGTWERLKGKVCLGLDEDDTEFNIIGQTGGEKEHNLTVNEMPEHRHSYTRDPLFGGEATSALGQSLGEARNNANGQYTTETTTGKTGGSQPHNNLQPYEVVGYMWIRRS